MTLDLLKRYWVVRYDGYYPSGFLNDVDHTADSLDECNQFLRAADYKYDFELIFDRETGDCLEVDY